MKHITILVPYDAAMPSLVDPGTIFRGVNDFLIQAGREPVFQITMAGLEKSIIFNDGIFTVKTDALIHDIKKTDLIIIPALGGDLKKSIEKNQEFIPWIIAQHKKGAEVASLCIGSFLLAATGMLDGKECSSHWLTASLFREMFPEVNLIDGRVVTEQSGLYSSGGASSYWSLLLHLVEKYAGRDMAILASKIFALDIDRKTQSPFAMFRGQKRHEDEPIKQAQDFIENNLSEKITIEDLASKYAIGRRHFERRFKKATHNTPLEYMQRVKIEAAKKSLESTSKNVTEVMYDVGYLDGKAFRTIFKKITGLSPIDYRNKYNKEAAVV